MVLVEFANQCLQKSYFMLSDAERDLLNNALEKYRLGQSEPILVGGKSQFKPEGIQDGKVVSSYTRWVDAVHAKGAENQEFYLTFSPRFERIWLEAKRRLVDY